ncbi:hypothetical protein MMC27_001889 [Xylographa pallens]|nr:hypothetical protein [Xylographa pallens]
MDHTSLSQSVSAQWYGTIGTVVTNFVVIPAQIYKDKAATAASISATNKLQEELLARNDVRAQGPGGWVGLMPGDFDNVAVPGRDFVGFVVHHSSTCEEEAISACSGLVYAAWEVIALQECPLVTKVISVKPRKSVGQSDTGSDIPFACVLLRLWATTLVRVSIAKKSQSSLPNNHAQRRW